jgi:hypothetical protein
MGDLYTRLVKDHRPDVLAEEALLQINFFAELQLFSVHAEIWVKLLLLVYFSMQEHISCRGPEVFLISSFDIIVEKVRIAIFGFEPFWGGSPGKQGSDVRSTNYGRRKFFDIRD